MVSLSEDDHRAIEETNYLSSVPGMVESIQEAKNSNDFISGEEL